MRGARKGPGTAGKGYLGLHYQEFGQDSSEILLPHGQQQSSENDVSQILDG